MLSFVALILLWQSQPVQTSRAGSAAVDAVPATVDVPTPKNPKERLELAAKTNGLAGLGVPWHLRATYKFYGPDGQAVESGTFEEWRAGQRQYRVALRNSAGSREEFATDHGVFVLSQGTLDRRPLRPIQFLIESPVNLPKDLSKYRLENYQGKSDGDTKASCTALIEADNSDTPQESRSYCFAPMNAAVLYSCNRGKGEQAAFGPLAVARGQNFGGEIQAYLLGQPFLTVHIEMVEGMTPAGMSALLVPAGAQQVDEAPNSPDLVTPVDVVKAPAPDYPPDAKWHRVEGEVVVSATIRADGRATDLQVLAGPEMLRKAAIESVHRWVFKPSEFEGKPVETDVSAIVHFRLQHNQGNLHTFELIH
jgi:TonB family protein